MVVLRGLQPLDSAWLCSAKILVEVNRNLGSRRRQGEVAVPSRQATLWRLEASALLEVQERVLPAGAREVRFHQLEGDFKVPLGGQPLVPSHPPSCSASTGSGIDGLRATFAVGFPELC